MGQFDLRAADHFFRGVASPVVSPPVSFKDFIHQKLRNRQVLREGTTEFQAFQREAVREIERRIFLAASNYRRGEDLMLSSSAHWSWITMYYSSFHAAHAILGLVGVTVDPPARHIEVAASASPQALEVNICQTTYKPRPGPHAWFWDLYYSHVASLSSQLPTPYRGVCTPAGGGERWQINQRNLQNYHTDVAFQTMEEFSRNFDATRYPASLARDFGTQVDAARSGLGAAIWMADAVGLSCDVEFPLHAGPTRIGRLEAAFQGNINPFPPVRPLV